jgi:hypothetical protein
MKPIRRKQSCQVTTDPLTGQDRVLGWTQEEDVLSDQGSIDSTTIQRTCFLDCGCHEEPAGRCFECGAISCATCHGRCASCQKPTCMQHSHFLQSDSGEPVRLCGECYTKTCRKQFRAKLGRFALSLFIRREVRDE